MTAKRKTRSKAKALTATRLGRPLSYNEKVGAAICFRLSEGASLREITKPGNPGGFPQTQTIYRWLVTVPSFSAQYALARKAQAHRWAEELIEISDGDENDITIDEKGNPRVDHENINRSRLRVDTRKWLLSKLLPNEYGESMAVTGANGAALVPQQIDPMDYIEIGRRMAFVMAAAAHAHAMQRRIT